MTFTDKIDNIVAENSSLISLVTELTNSNIYLHEKNQELLKENINLQNSTYEETEQKITNFELETIGQGQQITDLEIKQIELEIRLDSANEIVKGVDEIEE